MLQEQELRQLEATLLPALERHHLRLLAHGLRTLQAVAERRCGAPPPPEAVAHWLAAQPGAGQDASFSAAFLNQLAVLGDQLAAIAAASGREPLALELEDLCRWAVAAADQRVRPGNADDPPGCDHHGQPPTPAGSP